MTTGKRRALIGVGSVLGIAAIALAIFIARLDQNKAKKYISAGVSKATGRQLSINGDLKLDLGWLSTVSASQIQFENAGWSKHTHMAEIGNFDVQIDLWQLLTKFRLVIPTLTITQTKVILEKNAAGLANWDFTAAAAVTDAVVPEQRTEFPIIEKLVIKDGTLSFDNQETKTQIERRRFFGTAGQAQSGRHLSKTAAHPSLGRRFVRKPEEFKDAVPAPDRSRCG